MRSMTAFARGVQEFSGGAITIEIKSVNHRYLEPQMRIPERFRELESWLRDLLRKKLARGKVDVSLNYRFDITQQGLDIDEAALNAVKSACTLVSSEPVDPIAVLQWPGVLKEKEADMEAAMAAAKEAAKLAIAGLIENRAREGAAMFEVIDARVQGLKEQAAIVEGLMPELLEGQRQKLVDKLAEFKESLEPTRLEAEFVILAQKADVDEELDRLSAHLDEVSRVIRTDKPVGRRLDFLMQELNREANTLSSKSFSAKTTNAAVEMKVLIEQMREQIQNIE